MLNYRLKIWWVSAALFGALSAFPSDFIWADEGRKDITELSLEELMNITIYSASKHEQKATEAPSSVSVVTADEIKKYGYRTLADILRSLRSFYITYDRNYSYVGIRGFARPGDFNSRILVLIDGHRINDNVYDSVSIGTDFIIDVDIIDRVEVVRGPGSSLYGSNALFAVVNVITKQGRDLKGVEISGDAGSFKTFKGRLSYGDRFQNAVEPLLSGSVFDSKGARLFFKEFEDPAANNGLAEHADYDRFHSYFTKLSYYDFTLQGAYIKRTKGIPTASYGTDFNDPRNKTIDSRYYLDLKYEHTLNRQFDILTRLFYDWYGYKGDYIYSGVVNKDLSDGAWWGGELQVAMKLLDKHRMILGAEYQDNVRQKQKNYDEEPYFLYLDDKRNSKILAVYIQDEFVIFKNLLLNAGVRHDHYDTFGSATNPRLALIYNPFEKTTFKFLYGSAFRAPNNYELYYEDATTAKSNPDLKPETIKTYELVYEQAIGEHLRGTAAAYYYKIKDLINQIHDPADNLLVFRNIDVIKAKGLEVELEGKQTSGLEGRISYTFQKSNNVKTKEDLTNSPRHLAKLNLIVPFIKEKFFAGLEEQYMSKRKTLAGNYAKGFFVSNLTLYSRNLLKRLEISGSVYNLFNKKYGDPGGEEHLQDLIQQDGRTYRVKLTYTF